MNKLLPFLILFLLLFNSCKNTGNNPVTTVAPDPPTLLLPSDGDTTVSIQPTLVWNPSKDASFYILQVSTNNIFTSLVYDQNVGNVTSKQITGLTLKTNYYWRVSTANSYGQSYYSVPFLFNTGYLPNAPNLLSPVNDAKSVPIPLTLQWDSVSSAISYAVQVSKYSTFNTFEYDQTVGNVIGTLIPGLVEDIKYYWRVNCTTSLGTSPWSSIFSFTTGQIPSPPNLAYPIDGKKSKSINPKLVWYSSPHARSYHLQVSTTNNFSSFVFNGDVGNDTNKVVSGLMYEKTNFWRVSASNDNGTSAFSNTWSFTTSNVTGQPIPTIVGTDGMMATISFNYTIPGVPISIDIIMGYALLGLPSGVNAGGVGVNGNNIKFATGNGINFYLSFSNTNPSSLSNVTFNGSQQHTWIVTGGSGVPAMNYGLVAPNTFEITAPNSGATITKGNALNVTWSNATTTDSIIIVIESNSDDIQYESPIIPDNGSYIIPATYLSQFPLGDALLKVVKFRYNKVNQSGKYYSLIAEIIKSVYLRLK